MTRVVVVTDNSMLVGAIRAGLHPGGAFQLLGYVGPGKATVGRIKDTGAEVVLVDEADCLDQAITLIEGLTRESEGLTVVLLTLRMEGDWLERAFVAGASGAISKTVHPGALATLLHEALNGHIVHPFAGTRARSDVATLLATEDSSLTERELEILGLVAAGATNREIGKELWIAQPTVKFHVSNIYRKLGVSNRTKACHYAHINGILPPQESARVAS
jgi:DNA-binding NarL/FixJ family response regulator